MKDIAFYTSMDQRIDSVVDYVENHKEKYVMVQL